MVAVVASGVDTPGHARTGELWSGGLMELQIGGCI